VRVAKFNLCGFSGKTGHERNAYDGTVLMKGLQEYMGDDENMQRKIAG